MMRFTVTLLPGRQTCLMFVVRSLVTLLGATALLLLLKMCMRLVLCLCSTLITQWKHLTRLFRQSDIVTLLVLLRRVVWIMLLIVWPRLRRMILVFRVRTS